MEVSKALRQNETAPVYLFYGKERFFIEEWISILLQQNLPNAADKSLNYSRFDLSETHLDAFLDEAQATSFLAHKRVLLGTKALFFTAAKHEEKPQSVERLLRYMEQPLESTLVIFWVPAEKLDERKKLTKVLRAKYPCFAASELREQEVVHWLQQQGEEKGLKVSGEAAWQLVRKVGSSLHPLARELEKIRLFLGEGKVLDHLEQVDDLLPRRLEENVFALSEAAARKQPDRALSILADLLEQKEEPIKIVALLARQFRLILQVQTLDQRQFPSQQMAGVLGVHPYAVKVAQQQARNFTSSQLKGLLAELADMDYHMKTGQVDKSAALEIFLLRLFRCQLAIDR